MSEKFGVLRILGEPPSEEEIAALFAGHSNKAGCEPLTVAKMKEAIAHVSEMSGHRPPTVYIHFSWMPWQAKHFPDWQAFERWVLDHMMIVGWCKAPDLDETPEAYAQRLGWWE